MNKIFFLIIYGPTGVGKSDVALLLAKQIRAEIVNMDVGQFYTPLSIGTAKPVLSEVEGPVLPVRHSLDDGGSERQRTERPVFAAFTPERGLSELKATPGRPVLYADSIPHHLFNILDEPKDFTVVEYRQAVIRVMHEIWNRGNVPILVGGSGFYAQSLFFPPITQDQQKEPIKKEYSAIPEDKLWDLLYSIDQQRAKQVHKHDIYRITRALDIWYATGKKPSSYIPEYSPIAPCMLLFLTRNKEDLYARINQRVIWMLEQGWLDEVKALKGTAWESFLQEKKLIGYNELFTYLATNHDELLLQKTITTIQQLTRQYAKRQRIFWKMLEKQLKNVILNREIVNKNIISLEEINLTLLDLDLYIKQLTERLSKL